MAVFTPEDHEFFADQGYVIARKVVPEADCNAVIDALWEFLGLDRSNPDDWYRLPLKPGGMIEMYQHQAEWVAPPSSVSTSALPPKRASERFWAAFLAVSAKQTEPEAPDRSATLRPSRPGQ